MKEEKVIQEVQKVFDSMHLEPEMLEKAIDGKNKLRICYKVSSMKNKKFPEQKIYARGD